MFWKKKNNLLPVLEPGIDYMEFISSEELRKINERKLKEYISEGFKHISGRELVINDINFEDMFKEWEDNNIKYRLELLYLDFEPIAFSKYCQDKTREGWDIVHIERKSNQSWEKDKILLKK